MLKTHYRQPIDWTNASLKESGREISRWSELISSVPSDDAIPQEIVDALSEDLNTHEAITILRGYHKSRNAAALSAATSFLGFSTGLQLLQGRKHKVLYADGGVFLSGNLQESGDSVQGFIVTRPDIQALIDARNEARKAKNFKEADRIRDELLAKGIVLKDSPTGTTWEVKR
jgi:cysteinyl-tRNA synthetase